MNIKQTSLTAVHIAGKLAYDYVENIREQKVFPDIEAINNLSNFDKTLPIKGTDCTAILELLHKYGSPATVASTGGRYFGLVVGGTTPAAMGANIITSSWDQIALMQSTSPVSYHLEKIASKWILELLNLPLDAYVGFVTGSTMAHLNALAAARQEIFEKKGYDFLQLGLINSPKINYILSAEAHISVIKALRILGVGKSQMYFVPCDEQGRIIVNEIPEITEDTVFILQAGNVNSGNSDDFLSIIKKVKDKGGWVHIDGAFGLWARASQLKSYLVEGVDNADSWSLDAHKWLNTPYDCGISIVRNKSSLQKAMTTSASYVHTDEDWQAKDMLPEFSRKPRGIEVWAAISELGASGIEKLVDRCCKHAKVISEKLDSLGFDILNDVVLNQIVFSWPNLNVQNLFYNDVINSGECWFGRTQWKGHDALRISVSSWATDNDDIERVLHIFERSLSKFV